MLHKNTTKLVFFKGEEDAPFALVLPGGGFTSGASIQEGFPYAQSLCQEGYNVFVLKYRVGKEAINRPDEDYYTAPINHMAVTLNFIINNAETFGIITANFSVWGSSAGGNILSNFCASNSEYSYANYNLPKPATVIMVYPGLARNLTFTADDPAAFIIIGANDELVPVAAVDERVQQMRDAGIVVEYTKYED